MPPIELLSVEHLAAVRQLLSETDLPNDDCGDPDNRFYGIYHFGQLIACGGLQAAGSSALLRSVAVSPAHQGKGLGQQLVDYLLLQAAVLNLQRVYLLTETAADYFLSIGFQPVERSAVPDKVTRTAQFTTLCPDSAVCLMKNISLAGSNT